MPPKNKDKKKKKTIPRDKILKAIKGQQFVDLGEPFDESARQYLAFQLTKLIDQEVITGSVITPEGVYLAYTATEVKDIAKLIKAKGICVLKEVAQENNWDYDSVYLIAKNRLTLLNRKDKKVITRESALDLVFQEIISGKDVSLNDVAEELSLEITIIEELLNKLIEDQKVDGVLIKSTNTFLPMEMLEESIKEKMEDFEMADVVEVKFSTLAEEYGISEKEVYNILLKLYNVGDIDVQLNLGQKTCFVKANITRDTIVDRIPDEEKKLDIEDLTEK
ncbi:MAG: hypothetical protein ACTSXA_09275 [Candidatus Heimdallarchaeota archaeon]